MVVGFAGGDAELRKELSSAVYQELLHAKHAEERGMFYAWCLCLC